MIYVNNMCFTPEANFVFSEVKSVKNNSGGDS